MHESNGNSLEQTDNIWRYSKFQVGNGNSRSIYSQFPFHFVVFLHVFWLPMRLQVWNDQEKESFHLTWNVSEIFTKRVSAKWWILVKWFTHWSTCSFAWISWWDSPCAGRQSELMRTLRMEQGLPYSSYQQIIFCAAKILVKITKQTLIRWIDGYQTRARIRLQVLRKCFYFLSHCILWKKKITPLVSFYTFVVLSTLTVLKIKSAHYLSFRNDHSTRRQ